MRRTALSLLFLVAALGPAPARAADGGGAWAVQRLDRTGFRLTLPDGLAGGWRDLNVGRLRVLAEGGSASLDAEPLPAGRALDLTVAAPGCSLVSADVGPGAGRGRSDAWLRVTHSFKVVVCAGTDDAAADRVARQAAGPTLTAKAGGRIEIRPLFNPAALVAGSDLPVRLYSRRAATAGAEVEAIAPDGSRRTARADGVGIAVVDVSAPGRWRLRFDDGGAIAELEFDVLDD